MTNTLITLLIIYQLKHFLADYPLQTPYMLGKFKGYPDFIKPLLAHSLVHGVFTLSIALFFNPSVAVICALIDLTIHFIIDRIKASPNLLGKYVNLSKEEYLTLNDIDASLKRELEVSNDNLEIIKNLIKRHDERRKENTYFWWALGWDQMMHHLTHYLLIWIMLK